MTALGKRDTPEAANVFEETPPTTVEVHGHSFTFKVDDPERLRRAAELVEGRIKTLEERSKLPSTVKLAIWTALEFAVEWLNITEDRERNLDRVRLTVERVLEELETELGPEVGSTEE